MRLMFHFLRKQRQLPPVASSWCQLQPEAESVDKIKLVWTDEQQKQTFIKKEDLKSIRKRLSKWKCVRERERKKCEKAKREDYSTEEKETEVGRKNDWNGWKKIILSFSEKCCLPKKRIFGIPGHSNFFLSKIFYFFVTGNFRGFFFSIKCEMLQNFADVVFLPAADSNNRNRLWCFCSNIKF